MNRILAAFFAQPRWKKMLLGLSALLLAGGGAASGVSRLSSPEDSKSRGEVTLPRRDRSSLPGSATALGTDAGVQKTLLPGGASGDPVGTETVANRAPTGGPIRESETAADDDEEVLAPAALQGGFSFFAAFAAGYALRAFLKLSFIYIGLMFLTIFFLSWIGWIDVRWDVPEQQFASLTETLKRQFESFRAFIGGSLPSAGMAGLGLITGLKRK